MTGKLKKHPETMRMMITGTDNPNVLASFYARYLSELPVEIKKLAYFDYYFGAISKSFFARVLNRLYPDYFCKKVDSMVMQQIEAFQPDLVLIFKGMGIKPSTLKKIKAKNIKLVNYNADHPFRFSFRGSGNDNVRNSIPLYDLHISYSQLIIKELEQKYGCQTAFLPFGFELDEADYHKIEADSKEELKLCFLGNPDPERTALIKSITTNGIPVDVYGHDWKNWLKPNSTLSIFGPVEGTDYYKTLRKYRIQLNVFREHNVDSHNMRTFEVPAVGGIQLAPQSAEHRLFFKEGQEIFLYENESECIEKARYLLSLPEEEAKKIRLNARKASIERKYSYKDRAEEAFNILKNVFETS